MDKLTPILRRAPGVLAVGLLLSVGVAHAAAARDALAQTNFWSSIKESVGLDPSHEVVRGHFDLGQPPNVHRYYCLIDTRTGRPEPNGVLGRPFRRPDASFGLKVDSVSLYACADAEKRGMLVTAGYRLPGAARAARPSPPPAPPPAASPPAISPAPIDVAGVHLGMSLARSRAVLESKKLRQYRESMETLDYWQSADRAMRSIPDGSFVSVIETWSAPAAGAPRPGNGESYEVMFTPVPGEQRVVAIIHTLAYSPKDAVRETDLEKHLVDRYAGFAGPYALPDSPTWRIQRDGVVQVGDPCRRRELFGGLGRLDLSHSVAENIALTKPPAELRFEIAHCGVSMVTEDHETMNGGALPQDRRVTRITVTAYSPSIALQGAEAAARLIRAAEHPPRRPADARGGPAAAPDP
ncbi:MAG TPA: hypothetical protein VND80_09705 [Steroidobacteraceae bacterium]|nr:hypothetical protein [Steroidobacteraceae bacterium]